MTRAERNQAICELREEWKIVNAVTIDVIDWHDDSRWPGLFVEMPWPSLQKEECQQSGIGHCWSVCISPNGEAGYGETIGKEKHLHSPADAVCAAWLEWKAQPQ